MRVLIRNLIVNAFIGAKFFPRPLRPWALRRYGMSVGNSMINAGVFFDGRNARRIRIGDLCMLNNEVYIDGYADVTIGDRVAIAPRVSIYTATHMIGPRQLRAGPLVGYPVTIEDGVWIGGGSTILPGARIGKGAVIGAGSLVVKDCEPDGLYVGRPARLVRYLDADGDPGPGAGAEPKTA